MGSRCGTLLPIEEAVSNQIWLLLLGITIITLQQSNGSYYFHDRSATSAQQNPVASPRHQILLISKNITFTKTLRGQAQFGPSL